MIGGRRSSFGSRRPRAPMSTGWCDSRAQMGLPSTDGLTVYVVPGRALAVDLVAACFSGLSCHLACSRCATSLPSWHEHRPFWPLCGSLDRRSTMRWHSKRRRSSSCAVSSRLMHNLSQSRSRLSSLLQRGIGAGRSGNEICPAQESAPDFLLAVNVPGVQDAAHVVAGGSCNVMI